MRATLDGVGIPFALALHLLQNGSVLPAALDRYQRREGFRFESAGSGIFRTTIPDVFTNRDNSQVWTEPHGSRSEGYKIFNGGEFTFSFGDDENKDPKIPGKPISFWDKLVIGYGVNKLLTDQCANFLDSLIGKATGEKYDSRKQLIEDLGRVDSIIAGSSKFDYANKNVNAEASGTFGGSSRISLKNRSTFKESMTILHELIHIIVMSKARRFGTDMGLSETVKKMGNPPVIPYLNNKELDFPTAKDNSGDHPYSHYWDMALRNHCGNTTVLLYDGSNGWAWGE